MVNLPPKETYHFADLPLTRLHYLKCGQGPPLILVPATVSEIKNWLTLVQFMAQRFTVYFFELPGHGKSIKFKNEYRSEVVAETVGDFVDYLGYKRFNIMGFSFGGLLTIKTLIRLKERIDSVILFSPYVSYKSLLYSKSQFNTLKIIAKMLKRKQIKKLILNIMHNKKTVNLIELILRNVGNIDKLDGFRENLLNFKDSTLDVFTYQLNEILDIRFKVENCTFKNKLYFGMSVHDSLLDYEITKNILKKMFENMKVEKFYLPYHQPLKPFTFEELNSNFFRILEQIE